MKLVIQVQAKTEKINEIKNWIKESFSIIENKKKGFQDYSLIDSENNPSSECTGTLPFDGNEDEMIIMETLADSN